MRKKTTYGEQHLKRRNTVDRNRRRAARNAAERATNGLRRYAGGAISKALHFSKARKR